MIHARCIVLIEEEDSDKVGKFVKVTMQTLLTEKFSEEAAFEAHTKSCLPKAHWKSVLSVNNEIRTKICKMAMTHYKTWVALKAYYNGRRSPDYCLNVFMHPKDWVMDVVQVFTDVWCKSDTQKGNTSDKDVNLYKPLFHVANYNNQNINRSLDKGSGYLWYLPENKVMLFKVQGKSPNNTVMPSIAAKWCLEVSNEHPVTGHFPYTKHKPTK